MYLAVFWLVKSFLLHAPALFGGFEGIDSLDVCSQITGISSTLLVKSPDLCDERISTYVHGKAVIVSTALLVLAAVYSLSFVRFLVGVALELRNQSAKRENNQRKADRDRQTRQANLSAFATLSTIKTVVLSAQEPATKLALVEQALQQLDSTAQSKLT